MDTKSIILRVLDDHVVECGAPDEVANERLAEIITEALDAAWTKELVEKAQKPPARGGEG